MKLRGSWVSKPVKFLVQFICKVNYKRCVASMSTPGITIMVDHLFTWGYLEAGKVNNWDLRVVKPHKDQRHEIVFRLGMRVGRTLEEHWKAGVGASFVNGWFNGYETTAKPLIAHRAVVVRHQREGCKHTGQFMKNKQSTNQPSF